jgi:hypothetical protein
MTAKALVVATGIIIAVVTGYTAHADTPPRHGQRRRFGDAFRFDTDIKQ